MKEQAKYTTLTKKLILIIYLIILKAQILDQYFLLNLEIYSEIKNGSISIEKIEVDQKQFKSKLNEITTGNQKQIKRTIRYKKNIKNLKT